MPLIVNMVSGKSWLVEGESLPPKPWKPGRLLVTKNVNTGRPISVQLAAIACAEIWPLAAYEAEMKGQEEAKRLAAEREVQRQMAAKGRKKLRFLGRRHK